MSQIWKPSVLSAEEQGCYWGRISFLIDTGKNLLMLFIAMCSLECLNLRFLSWYIYSWEIPYFPIIITQK